jgi:hypothetical protein
MAIVRFEVWTRPQTGTFERKFPLKGIEGYSIEQGIFGRGSITLPSNHSRINEILYTDPADHANDVGSMIRAYIGTTWIQDFYAARMSTVYGETGKRSSTIGGGGPGFALEGTITFPYDFPELPSIEPDWTWGYGKNLVKNGDFETDPYGAPNMDAEEGTTLGWYTTGDYVTNVGLPERFEAVNNAGTAHGGSWHFEIEADPYEGAIKAIPIVDEQDYVVSVWCEMTAGGDYRVSVDGVSEATVGTMFNNSCYVDVVGTGSYQDVGLAFTAAGNEARLHITSMDTGGVVRFDDVTMSGRGRGLDPWTTRGEVTTFTTSAILSHSGTFSMAWFPDSGIAGNDIPYQPINVVTGQTLTAKAWFYHTEAGAIDMRLTIRLPGVNPNTTNVASVQKSVPPTTWTEIVASGITTVPTVELELRYDGTGAPVSNLHTDDIVLYEGRPAATLGTIAGELLDDAATNHAPTRTALDWVSKTFSDTLDSGAVAWDQELNITAPMGQNYRRFTESSVDRFGYETRMKPNVSDESIIEWDIFNPVGMGTDYSTGDGNAVTNSGLVSFGPMIRTEPRATYGMVGGKDQYYGEALDITMQGVWGDKEAYEGSDEMSVGILQTVAAGLVSGNETLSFTAKFQNPALVPGVNYQLGDTVMVVLGEDVMPAGAFRVYSIVVDSGDPEPTFQVQFVQEA